MARALVLTPLLLAGACAASGTEPPSAADRAAAEQFVIGAIEGQFPNYQFAPEAASCIGEAALDSEVLLLAGERQSFRNLTRMSVAIAQRPEAQACFQSKNLPRLS